MAAANAKTKPAETEINKTPPGQSVATIQSGGKAVALPDHMKGHEGAGTEAVGLADVAIPRIKLMQSQSPELDTFANLTRGQFFHTLLEGPLGSPMGEVVAAEMEARGAKLGRALSPEEQMKIDKNFLHQVRVVPIYTDMRYILWQPRDSGGGILARADDGIHWNPPNTEFTVTLDRKAGGQTVKWKTALTVAQSGLANWGTMNPGDPKSQPAATKMFNIVCGLPDFPDLPPVVVSLQRSAVGVGAKLIGKLKITRAPSYGMIFKMRSVKDSNGSDEFFNYQFLMDDMEPLVTDPELFNNYFEQYKYFKAEGLKVKDIETLQDEATGSEAGGGARTAPEAPAGAPKF